MRAGPVPSRRSRATSPTRRSSRPPSGRRRTRSIRATASWQRTPRSPRQSAPRGWDGSGLRPRSCASPGTSSRRRTLPPAAGLPVLPSGAPTEVGLPLILKAAAGGGGRGMRVVRARSELVDALAAARREAGAAFGDGTVYAERFVEDARHVEVQLLGDARGTIADLGAQGLLDPAAPSEDPRGDSALPASNRTCSKPFRRRHESSHGPSAT